MKYTCALVGLLVFAGAGAHAQACAPPEHPYFEFQVQRAAVYLGDSTALPRPLASGGAGAGGVVVSFVVDASGVPDQETFKVIKSPESGQYDALRAAVGAWRYRPAYLGGCPVPQLVQTQVRIR
jgi:hypothetical protein